jgi:DNA-binding NarL/FixJ family response regulator
MVGLHEVNLKVLIFDTDFYTLNGINGFLAWDRRTRVTHLSESLQDMWDYLANTSLAELPNIILLESDHFHSAEELRDTIGSLHQQISGIRVLCLAQEVKPDLVEAAAEAGASGYLLKNEVRLQITWAIVFSMAHDFVVTSSVAHATHDRFHHRLFHASVLPEVRKFPELTERIRQALKLCVLDGMPAHLAADEMGISLHTIRGYIKEGYRILEAYDDTEYPVDMTPQERAFMRITAFASQRDDLTNGAATEAAN